MNRFIKVTFFSLLIVSPLLLAKQVAQAQDATKFPTRPPVTRFPTRSLTRGPVQCDVTKSRLENKIVEYDRKHKKHIDSYNRMKDYGQKFVNKLKEKGYDTTALEADLETLTTTYLNKLTTDYNVFIGQLRKVRDEVCSYSSQDELKSAIDELKGLLAAVRQDIVDTKNFWHTTIQVDIKALRDTRSVTRPVRPTRVTVRPTRKVSPIRPTRVIRISPTIVRPSWIIE